MDIDEQFAELGPLLTGVVGSIDAAQLDDPTPCSEFSVRGVLEHMLAGATVFAAAFRGDEAADPDTSDPLGAFPGVLGSLAESVLAPGNRDKTVASPFGPVPGELFARFIVLDGLVHGWDLATATGQPYEPSPELVSEVRAFAEQALPMTRGSGAFADAMPAPEGATPIEELAALTGRTVATPA